MKKTILTFVAFYLPGYKSGGPLRTIANMVDHLGEEFDFRIVTADRDATDSKPYDGINIDSWNTVGKAQVFYCSRQRQSLMSLADIVKTTPHDLVYLNSFFSPTFTIKPLILRRMGILPERPFLLAPRGEFSKRALRLKRKKKALYLALSRNLGLYRDVAWQASSLYELNDIKTQLGIRDGKCFIAPDLGPVGTLYEESGVKDMHTPSHKKAQHLKVLFLSRISPMKNLDYALQVLAGVRVPLEFNIYGPIRDPAYWHYCKGLIKKLPNHIKVQYRGSVPHQQVRKIMKSHDLFFLPTRGENYGHVIPEALVAGTPVLIANTTPWRKLDRAGVGWDLPLSSKDVFISKIEEFAGMETSQFKEYRQRAKNFALKILADPKVVEANRRMLLTIISG